MTITEAIQSFMLNLWQVVLEAAPWLLLGLVAAGLIKALVPVDWMKRWLGGRGLGSIVRAAVIGTPLPLCSCGVLPAALGLRRAGASKGATVSFLVATPENGADSIAMSYALLGWFMTIVRPIAALVSAVVAGLLAELAPDVKRAIADDDAAKPQAAGCCGAKKATVEPVNKPCCGGEKKPEPEPVKKSCCSNEPKAAASDAGKSVGWTRRAAEGLRYAMTRIIDDIAVWLAIGLAAAAAITTFVPQSFLVEWGSGWTGLLVMLVVGLPMYICATASTPVAGSLLLAGVSPGAVLVFLLAGPATNVGSVLVLRRELGTWTVVGYLVGVCAGALGFGFATNLAADALDIRIAAQVDHAHAMMPHWLAVAAAAVLIFISIRPLRNLLIRPSTEARLGAEAAPAPAHASD